VAAVFREREGVLNELALGVKVENLVGIYEFRFRLEELHPRQDHWVEPVLNLKIS